MKPNLKLVLYSTGLLLVFNLQSFSQTATPETITMDLGDQPKTTYGDAFYKNSPYIKKDKPFYILVKNYNPIRYRVTITSTGTVTYQSTTNSLLTYVNTDATLAATSGNKAAAAPLDSKAIPAAISAKNAALTEDVKALVVLKKNLNDIIKKLNGDVTAISDFYAQLNGFQAEYEKWKLSPTLEENTVRTFRQTIYTNMYNTVNKVYNDHQTIPNPYEGTMGTYPDISINSYILLSFPGKVLDILKGDLTDLQTAADNLDAFEKAHHATMGQITTYGKISDYTAYRKDITDLQSVFKKFQTDYDQNYGKYLTALSTVLSSSEALKFFSWFGPYTMEGNDERSIKVAKLNLFNNNDDELKDNTPILVKRQGGIKIDFSAGIFFSNLSDRSYVSSTSTRITQDSTVNNGAVTVGPHQTTYSKIIQRGGSGYSYGPMAFIHFHSMNPKVLRYGVYVGTGFLFKDNAKPVLSLGGNLMLVDFQRLILGFGAAFGSVTRLSSKYQVDHSYPETITDVPTETHLNVKGLISLSWNLSK